MPPRKKYVLKSNLAEKKADDDDTNIYSQDIPIEKAV